MNTMMKFNAGALQRVIRLTRFAVGSRTNHPANGLYLNADNGDLMGVAVNNDTFAAAEGNCHTSSPFHCFIDNQQLNLINKAFQVADVDENTTVTLEQSKGTLSICMISNSHTMLASPQSPPDLRGHLPKASSVFCDAGGLSQALEQVGESCSRTSQVQIDLSEGELAISLMNRRVAVPVDSETPGTGRMSIALNRLVEPLKYLKNEVGLNFDFDREIIRIRSDTARFDCLLLRSHNTRAQKSKSAKTGKKIEEAPQDESKVSEVA